MWRNIGSITNNIHRSIWAISGRSRSRLLAKYVNSIVFAVETNSVVTVSVGALVAFALFLLYGSYHSKAVKQGKEWAMLEEYRRLPLAAVGAPL
jgi:hypothetical protein